MDLAETLLTSNRENQDQSVEKCTGVMAEITITVQQQLHY